MDEFGWSEWYPLSHPFLRNIPDVPGVYEVRTDYEFGRLNGVSCVVYIGSAARRGKPSLRKRLGGRITDPKNNLSGAEKLLQEAEHNLEFRFATAIDGNTEEYMEVQRLVHYERQHWELPPGNGVLPHVRN